MPTDSPVTTQKICSCSTSWYLNAFHCDSLKLSLPLILPFTFISQKPKDKETEISFLIRKILFIVITGISRLLKSWHYAEQTRRFQDFFSFLISIWKCKVFRLKLKNLKNKTLWINNISGLDRRRWRRRRGSIWPPSCCPVQSILRWWGWTPQSRHASLHHILLNI